LIHLGLGEHRAHPGDRHHHGRGRSQRSDLIGVEPHVTGSLFEEGSGTGRALLVEPERLHLPGLIDPGGLHRMASYVQDRLGPGEQLVRPPGGSGQLGNVQLAEGHLEAPKAGGNHVVEAVTVDPALGQRIAQTLLGSHARLVTGTKYRPGDHLFAVQQDDLGVGAPDVDASSDGHAIASDRRAGLRPATIRSIANNAAPTAPM